MKLVVFINIQFFLVFFTFEFYKVRAQSYRVKNGSEIRGAAKILSRHRLAPLVSTPPLPRPASPC